MVQIQNQVVHFKVTEDNMHYKHQEQKHLI
jgi:hypothetical protein